MPWTHPAFRSHRGSAGRDPFLETRRQIPSSFLAICPSLTGINFLQSIPVFLAGCCLVLMGGCATTDARVGLSTNEGPREAAYNSLTHR